MKIFHCGSDYQRLEKALYTHTHASYLYGENTVREILVLAFSIVHTEIYRPCHCPVRTYKQRHTKEV